MDIRGPNVATAFICPCPKEKHKTTFLCFFFYGGKEYSDIKGSWLIQNLPPYLKNKL